MVPALQGRRFPEQRVRTDPGRWRKALEAGRRPLLPEPWQDHRLRDEDGRVVRTEAHEARAAELGLHVEAWRSAQAFDAEQARWAGLTGNHVRADAIRNQQSVKARRCP